MTQQDTARRTVVIVRHAKAEPNAATDHARPLTEQGLADARAAGAWLAEHLDPYDETEIVALVSTATRARLTWGEIAAAVPARARMLDGLYQAGPGEVVETIAMLDDDVRVAVVVAHNPTMAQVADQLSDASTDAHEQMQRRGFPTSAVAVLAHAGPWHGLTSSPCRLTAFHVARG